jgi:hypothetical protein
MIKRLITTLFLLTIILNGLFSQIIEVSYQEWPYGCNFKSDSGKFIINSEKDFKELTSCILLNYDFDKYTIIGVQGITEGSGKKDRVDIRILKDDKNSKYIIEAIVYYCGHNRMIYPYKRVIYTDKLQSDYDIAFKVIFR